MLVFFTVAILPVFGSVLGIFKNRFANEQQSNHRSTFSEKPFVIVTFKLFRTTPTVVVNICLKIIFG